MTTVCRRVSLVRTLSVLAQEVGESNAKVAYILRTRDHIRPEAKAGNSYVYGPDAPAQVRHEINAIAARKLAGRETA